MSDNLARLFRASEPAPPRAALLDAVMAAVARERRRGMLMRRLPALMSGLALSAAAATYAIILTIDAAARSGIAGFLSMLVTDTGTVMASWQDYLLTLVDALPVAPLAGVCAALFVFFALLRRLDRIITPSSRLHTI